jgi:hypothetical protein
MGVSYTSHPPPIVIAPGDSQEASANILQLFNTSGIQIAGMRIIVFETTLHYLRAGTYELYAIQVLGKDTLRSESVVIVVRTPEGSEARALRVLQSADSSYLLPRFDEELSSRAYERFLVDHPESRYAPYALRKLIVIWGVLGSNYDSRTLKYIGELCRRFPDDPHTEKYLEIFPDRLARGAGRKVLEVLARSHPETRAGRLSSNILAGNRKAP